MYALFFVDSASAVDEPDTGPWHRHCASRLLLGPARGFPAKKAYDRHNGLFSPAHLSRMDAFRLL